MPSDPAELKSDILELKTNVSFIKMEMQDMKQSFAAVIEKISNSMAQLATVTEKLHNNMEEHKTLHRRIDDVEADQTATHDAMVELRHSHMACIENRKIEEDKKKNSPWSKAKDRIVEYLFIVMVVLTIYILFTHFHDFLTFMNSTGNANPVSLGK